MAKKVVVPTDDNNSAGGEKRPKKKRSKCCTCCLAVLIALIVILGAAFGVGWYFGDKFTRQYLDLSLADTLGVVNDLYWTKDKDVVKNPFSQDDLNGFYTEIKSNMFLKPDANVDLDVALDSALKKYTGTANGGAATARARNADGDGENNTSGGENVDGEMSTVAGVLIDMLAEVFTRDNIDVERLGSYSETQDDYIFNLRDKQLAAFADYILRAMLGSAGSIDMIKDYAGIVDFGKVVALKQIQFKATSAENEQGEHIVTATTADITVWLGVQNAAGQALTYYINDAGYGWASGTARVVGNMLLPKNLYVTLSIPLHGDAQINVILNDMNEKKRDRAYKLVNGVMSVAGADGTVQSYLAGIGDKLQPYLGAAADKIDFSSAAAGTIKLDIIDMLVNKMNGDNTVDPLTKADFMYLLQALLTSDPDARLAELKPYLHKNQYVDGSGTVRYDPADKTGMTLVDYETEFVHAIEDKYAVDFGENAKLKDVLAMLGVSLDGSNAQVGSSELLDKINSQRFHANLDRSVEDLKLRVTDRMLGAVFAEQMGSLVSAGNSGFADLDITLEAMTFVSGSGDRSDRTYALLAVAVGFDGMLGSFGGSDMLTKLTTNILPEKILLGITVDVTQNPPAGFEYDKASFTFNDCENTDRVVATLGKLVPNLDLSVMTGDVEKLLRDMIKNLDEKIGIELVCSTGTGDAVTAGQMVMPDIFTVISGMVIVDADGAPVVSGDELKGVLRALDNTDGVQGKDGHISADYSSFIADVVDKYYLDDKEGKLKTFADLTAFIGVDGFDASRFRLTGEDPSERYMAYDTDHVDALCPTMSAADLGALMTEQMKSNDGVKDYTIVQVRTTPEKLFVLLSIPVDKLMPSDVKSLLTTDRIYVTATVDITDAAVEGDGTPESPFAYPVEIQINSMNAETYADMLKIVKCFSPGFDVESQVAEFGKILYDQLASLKDGLGDDDFITFTNDGIMLSSFYAYLAEKLDIKSEDGTTRAEPKDVKTAIQGMYERSETAGLENPDNYAVVGSKPAFLLNPSDVLEYDALNPQFPMHDVDFNGYFQSLMVNGGMSSEVTAVQTIILGGGNNSVKAEAVRAWLDNRLATELEADRDYIIVTFKMVIAKNADPDNKDVKDNFMPDYVYVTVVLDKTVDVDSGNDKYEYIEHVFNDMDHRSVNVLSQMMGLSSDSTSDGKINVKTVVESSLSGLNGLSQLGKNAVFGEQTSADNGVGNIDFS